MTSKFTSSVFTAVSLLAFGLTSVQVDAATINVGGFNWEAFGDARLQGSIVTLTSAYSDGNDDATNLNLTGNDPLLAGGDLEGAFGLPSGALDVDNILNQASEGSGFSRVFAVNAGDKITFDWQLFTADDLNADYGFFTVGNSVFSLAAASAATLPGSGGYLAQTALSSYEYIFHTAGEFTVGLGVADIGDAFATTSLSVSNVSFTAVPEPSTYGIIVIALLGGLAFNRHCNRKRTA